VTIVLCSIALAFGGPCPPARGGHAVPLRPRGGHAEIVLEPTGPVPVWTCIHGHEGPWNDADDPYWGGLQMDRGFMLTYGRDMIRRYHGWANVWPPRDQMVVAWRAVIGFAGFGPRGYGPWPNTRHGCA
jgi:hypothetical protein